jgi:hypothetical protein
MISDWKLRSPVFVAFLWGTLIGAVVFVCIWGLRPLNPWDIDWTILPWGRDFSFAGIAAARFLQEPWTFPPGVTTSLVYPSAASIVYADSIPIVAIIAKVLASALGGKIQYFGFWGFFCAILQGGLANAILYRYSKDLLLSTIGALFIVFSPFFLSRTFGHVSMGGQWVILLPFLFITYRTSPWIQRNEIVVWAFVATISVGIISYFTPMVMGLAVLYFLLRSKDGRVKALFGFIATFILSALGCATIFYLAGGFLPGMQTSGGNYGDAPFNLASFFNPGPFSKLLPAIPLGADERFSGESYAWLGSGIMAGALILLLDVIAKRRFLPSRPGIIAAYLFAAFAFLTFAATNSIHFSDRILVTYPLPESLMPVLSAFRTSARFCWPVWYMIAFLIVGNLTRLLIPRIGRGVLLSALLVLQLWDGSNYLKAMHIPSQNEPKPPLSGPFWANIGTAGKHLYILPLWGTVPLDSLGQIIGSALRADLTSSFFWLGRYPITALAETIDGKLADLRSGIRRPGDILLLNYVPSLTGIVVPGDTDAYLVDGLVILADKGLAEKDIGARRIEIRSLPLIDYIEHLKTVQQRSLIVITARQSNVAAKLSEAVRSNLLAVGVTAIPDTLDEFVYVTATIGGRTYTEKAGGASINVEAERGTQLNNTVLPADVKIAMEPNRFASPEIAIGGEDVSRAVFGLNIAVYDMDRRMVTESAAFPNYAQDLGVVVQEPARQ